METASMIDYSTGGSVALLRLSDPPLNVLSFGMLDSLIEAIRRANDDSSVIGIIITGAEDHFSAGADVNLFRKLVTDDDAINLSRRFQEAFDFIEASGKPVAAAVAGSVMGGALELALAAHYRVAATSTRFSMPEVNLGILPGAGGTQRLPRVIGADAALTMLLSAKPIDAKEALIIGLVDAVSGPDDLLDTARKLVMLESKPIAAGGRTDKTSDFTATTAAFDKARLKAAAIRPEVIAPRMIIDTVETGLNLSYTDGLAAEQSNFAKCMATPATRSKIHLFFATRATVKIPDLETIEPVSIRKTAVIGMGSMGSGIAQAFASAGKKVLVLDTDVQTARKGASRIAESIERKVQRGALNRQKADAILGCISVAENWDELASVDLVIEAIFEDVVLKQSLMNKIGEICPDSTVVASNTSTIDLDLLAETLPRPERLIGLHFFNPAHSMPLVEVIRRPATDPRVVVAALQFVKELRKTPVAVNNSVGFIVNRLFIPYCIEAYRLLEEGAEAAEIDAAMVGFGFSMGPLALIDMTGIDILFFTDRMMRVAYPFHIPLSRIAMALVDENKLGQKTGCGIYCYEKDGRTPLPSGRTAEIIAQTRNAAGIVPRLFSREDITERLVLRMAAEAFRVVEEEIALRESDIDVAMVLGIGFPDFRGGIIHYARSLGLPDIVKRLTVLAATCGERYQPCYYLQSNLQESAHG